MKIFLAGATGAVGRQLMPLLVSRGHHVFATTRTPAKAAGRRFPIVGGGTGVWSFVHIADVAEATRIAIEGGPAGLYNIVDDDPAEVSVWLPELARAVGARPPYHVPAWLGRLVAGEAVVRMMTEQRGSSNAKAKRQLGWRPTWPSWSEGFSRELSLPRAA